jgi:uncharacterized protein (TIGR02117 family)
MKKAIKGLGLLVAFLILVVGAYIGVSFMTARMSSSSSSEWVDLASTEKTETIYLLTGTLHADFVIPAALINKGEFDFLKETKLPLDHPNLRYLAFGWGSKAFYTTAGSYSDITLSAVAKAVSGDQSVMRVVALGEIDTNSPDIIQLSVSKEQLAALVQFVHDSFQKSARGKPQQLSQASIGPNDVFYEGVGDFNIFHPCNQWVNLGLRKTGIEVGRWTPTTHSLRHSLEYFKSAKLN